MIRDDTLQNSAEMLTLIPVTWLTRFGSHQDTENTGIFPIFPELSASQ